MHLKGEGDDKECERGERQRGCRVMEMDIGSSVIALTFAGAKRTDSFRHKMTFLSIYSSLFFSHPSPLNSAAIFFFFFTKSGSFCNFSSVKSFFFFRPKPGQKTTDSSVHLLQRMFESESPSQPMCWGYCQSERRGHSAKSVSQSVSQLVCWNETRLSSVLASLVRRGHGAPGVRPTK